MKIIIFGASGMLGHVLYSELKKNHQVWGTVRSKTWDPNLLQGYDVSRLDEVDALIKKIKPDFVINCIGIIKQLQESKDRIASIEINSLWPHKLAKLCRLHETKMIHFSTDCVFSGKQGNYSETDLADARDIYGLSKLMGEVDYSHALTLRTSIIGHELQSNVSLVGWFLSQERECRGYVKTIYSGLPTIVVADFLENILFKNFITGLYHLSSEPINKFDLLKLIAEKYDKKINILPDESLVMDRSLNSNLIHSRLKWLPESWPTMINLMHDHFLHSGLYNKEIR